MLVGLSIHLHINAKLATPQPHGRHYTHVHRDLQFPLFLTKLSLYLCPLSLLANTELALSHPLSNPLIQKEMHPPLLSKTLKKLGQNFQKLGPHCKTPAG